MIIHMQNNKLQPKFHTLCKCQLKWFTDLNVKHETIQLFEKFCNLGLSKNRYYLNSTTHRTLNNDKLNFIEINF